MKKSVAAFVFAITLLLSSCRASDIAVSGGTVLRADRPLPTNIESYYKNENIVYVTKSGKKYHKEGCPYLKFSKIMMSLEQAVMEGKEPCSKCFGSNEND